MQGSSVAPLMLGPWLCLMWGLGCHASETVEKRGKKGWLKSPLLLTRGWTLDDDGRKHLKKRYEEDYIFDLVKILGKEPKLMEIEGVIKIWHWNKHYLLNINKKAAKVLLFGIYFLLRLSVLKCMFCMLITHMLKNRA